MKTPTGVSTARLGCGRCPRLASVLAESCHTGNNEQQLLTLVEFL